MSVLHISYIVTVGFVLVNAQSLYSSSIPLILVPKNETKDNQSAPEPQEGPYFPHLEVPVGSVLESRPDAPRVDGQPPTPVEAVAVNWNQIADHLNVHNVFKDFDFRPLGNEPNTDSHLENSTNSTVAEPNENQELGSANNPTLSDINGNLSAGRGDYPTVENTNGNTPPENPFYPKVGDVNGNPQSEHIYTPTVSELSIKLTFLVRNFDPTHDLQVTYEADPNGYEVTYKVFSFLVGGGGFGGGFGGSFSPSLNPQSLKIAAG